MTLQEAIEKDYKYTTWRRFGLKAFSLGFIASQEGKSENACPYPDLRTDRGNVTFSRAYRRRWFTGYAAHQKTIVKGE